MKEYKKPICISQENIRGIVPLAAVAAIAGTVGGAALIGATAGLASKGDRDFVPVKNLIPQV